MRNGMRERKEEQGQQPVCVQSCWKVEIAERCSQKTLTGTAITKALFTSIQD